MQTMYDLQKLVEKLPDNVLMAEANKPTGRLPTAMVIGEITKRKQLRIAAQGQEAAQQEAPRQMFGMQDGGPVSKRRYADLSDEQLQKLLGDPGLVPAAKIAINEEILARNEAKTASLLEGRMPPDVTEEDLYDPYERPVASPGAVPKRPTSGLGAISPSTPPDAKTASAPNVTSDGKRKSNKPSGKPAVNPSISFPKAPPAQTSAYPEYQDPYAQIIAELSKERNLSNPFDSAVAAQSKVAGEKPKWGEAGLAAAAAMLQSKGSLANGIGAGIGAALPVMQQNKQMSREDQRYLQQLRLQQAQAAQQNQNTQFDQRLRLGEAQGNQIKGKQDYGLGQLNYNQEAAKNASDIAYKEGMLSVAQQEAADNGMYKRAAAGNVGSGGGINSIIKAAAAIYNKAYADAKEMGASDEEAKASANAAVKANPYLAGLGAVTHDEPEFDIDGSSLGLD
jgi:hypothetical protein